MIDLDGPAFVDPVDPADRSTLTPVDSFVPDMADAAAPDLAVDRDARPVEPTLAGFELELGAIAPVVVHTATGQVRSEAPAALSHRLQVGEADGITALYDAPPSLITLLRVEQGERARIDPLPSTGRATSMRAYIAEPFPEAAGYAMTNGCRHLRCMGDACAGWFEDAEMSLAITDRCTQMNRVRTVALALDADAQPQGWAIAQDAFPASSNSAPTFGEWHEAFQETPVLIDGLDDAHVFAAPWLGVPYDADLPTRRTGSGRRAVRVPRGVSEIVEFGLDFDPPDLGPALGRSTQGIRYWRRAETTLPVIFEAARLPPIPTVEVEPDPDGFRPRIRWRFADDTDQAGRLARIEFAWESLGLGRIEWVLFTAADAGSVRLPHLPDRFAAWRPGIGAAGLSAQVTIVDCLGVDDLSAYYRDACPVLAPSQADPLHQEVRWSAGYARPDPDEDPGSD